MANTPESPFDRVNRLLDEQKFLNEQQSAEFQSAIQQAQADFPNNLANAQTQLNQNLSGLMGDFNSAQGKITNELTAASKNLSITPSQMNQFQSELQTGLTQINSQMGDLENFKAPLSSLSGNFLGPLQGGLSSGVPQFTNAVSTANFDQFNQAVAQGQQALGTAVDSQAIQNAFNSAKGELANLPGDLPNRVSQLAGSIQLPGEGNFSFPADALNPEEIGRLVQDATGELDGAISGFGDQIGGLTGQVQEGLNAIEQGVRTLPISFGSGSGSDASKQQKTLSIQKVDNSQELNQGQNKLHNFESYTYRITLYLLTKEELVNLYEKPRTFTPKHVMISSGGSFSKAAGTDPKGRARLEDFEEDFFIEDLDIQTVVGLNNRSKASNAIDVTFTIVEPYGLTLLDRLLSACDTVGKCKNYIEQPYLLEIDFLANPTGEIRSSQSIQIDQKRIPIKLMEMKIKPGVSGSEYKCRAIPFNHTAFLNTAAATPTNLSVVAGTVGEFFSSQQLDNVAENQERAEADLAKFLKSQPFNGAGFNEQAREQKRQEFLKQYDVLKLDSYPTAYNNYFKSISGDSEGKTFIYPPNQIQFVIDDEIKNSKIVRETKTESRTTKMNDLVTDYRLTHKPGVLSFGKTRQDFPISAGTNVIQLIDRVIQRSDYIHNQVKDSKKAIEEFKQAQESGDRKAVRAAEAKAKQYKYLDWYKIIPHIKLEEFDISRNAYAKKITYHIKKYKVANAYHPDFAITRITKDKIVRSYDYLYTGNNKDITDIDIDFDSTYYTQITAFHGAKQRPNAKENSKILSANNPNEVDNQGADAEDGNAVRQYDLPTTYQSRSANSQEAGQLSRQDDSTSQAINDIATSIYTTQRGDMLNLRLGIIGDPDYIKQDDMYINPESSQYNDFVPDSESSPINPNFGTISYDSQQVYVQLLFKSAVDIDDTIGITNKGLPDAGGKAVKLSNGRNLNGTFNGVYKVLTVSNRFSGGEFTQVLDIIKMPNDLVESDEVAPQNNGVEITTEAPKKGISADSIADQITSANNSATQPAGVPTDFDEQLGVFQQDIERFAPAFAELPTSPVPSVEGLGVAEGLSVAFNQTQEQLSGIIDANRQVITARPDNIINTAFQTAIGTQAPSENNREIFAGDIPENTG